MTVDTVIKNGMIVSTEGIYSAGVAISAEKIVAIGTDDNLPEADRTIDAEGNFVIPGLVDGHVHFLYPLNGWEEKPKQRQRGDVLPVFIFLPNMVPEVL